MRRGSALRGRGSQTKLPYVTLWPPGIWEGGMKEIVLKPLTLSNFPVANLSHSFSKACVHWSPCWPERRVSIVSLLPVDWLWIWCTVEVIEKWLDPALVRDEGCNRRVIGWWCGAARRWCWDKDITFEAVWGCGVNTLGIWAWVGSITLGSCTLVWLSVMVERGSGGEDGGGCSGCWLLQSVQRSFAKVDIALKVSSSNSVDGKILSF